jgi:curli biogenesis system outer membrane secretion channel CsgG
VLNDAPSVVLFAAVRVVEVAGAEVIFTAAVNVSFASAAVCVTVIKVLDFTPIREGDGVPAETVTPVSVAALAGATDVRTPRPKAATATSATRLKVVFVDICFLSISRSEEFPPVGFG